MSSMVISEGQMSTGGQITVRWAGVMNGGGDGGEEGWEDTASQTTTDDARPAAGISYISHRPARRVKACSQLVSWTELTRNKLTQLHDAFVGHARQRHDLIGCSRTRTVGSQSVRALWTLPLEYTCSEPQFSLVRLCAVNKPLLSAAMSRPKSHDRVTWLAVTWPSHVMSVSVEVICRRSKLHHRLQAECGGVTQQRHGADALQALHGPHCLSVKHSIYCSLYPQGFLHRLRIFMYVCSYV